MKFHAQVPYLLNMGLNSNMASGTMQESVGDL